MGPTPGAVMNRRTCALLRASRSTFRSRSAICRSTASRALSSGSIAAASDGRLSASSAARLANTFIFAWPMTRPRFLRRPRIWFSISRLILTSGARLTRRALVAEFFDTYLLVPSTLHDARDAHGVVTVALVDLHLQGRLRVPGIDADDGQPLLTQFGP